jgi:hypothetical protein
MEPPFLYKGTESLKVSAETVFATVKSIVESGEEAEFLRVCKEQGAAVTVAPEFINLVKTYLFERGAHKFSAMAQGIVKSATCDSD